MRRRRWARASRGEGRRGDCRSGRSGQGNGAAREARRGRNGVKLFVLTESQLELDCLCVSCSLNPAVATSACCSPCVGRRTTWPAAGPGRQRGGRRQTKLETGPRDPRRPPVRGQGEGREEDNTAIAR